MASPTAPTLLSPASEKSRPTVSPWWTYVLAVTLAAATVLLRQVLSTWVGERPLLIMFIIPMIISAYAGGLGPGLVCTAVIGLGVDYFLMPPIHGWAIERPLDLVQWLILVLTGGLISLLTEALHRARRGTLNDPADSGDLVTQRKVQTGFGFALGVLGLIGVVSYVAVVHFREDAALVEHTTDVINRLNALFAETTDAENGHRGFAVTGEENYLEPYQLAVKNLTADLQRLRTLMTDNPGQQQRLTALAPVIDRQMIFGRRVIDARRNQGLEAARDLMLTHEGQRLHDQIRSAIEDMKNLEAALFEERKARATRSATVTQAVIVGGSLLGFAFVGMALFTIQRDFAGRRRAEKALRRSEENLGVTLQSIGDGVLATDTKGRITRMNRVAEQLTGWTLAEATSHPIGEVFKIIHETTRAPAKIPVDDVIATGEIQGLANHTVLISRGGIERAIADSAAPIRDRDGHLIGVVLVFRDVTAERALDTKLATALDELARERERLMFIFESMPVGVSFAVHDGNGRKTRLINDAHLRISGLTREQTDQIGAFVGITHPDDRPPQGRLLQQLNDGTINRYAMDKRYVRADGHIVWIMLSCQRRRHPDGSFEDLSVVVDITERKQAVAELERFFELSLDFLCISSADGYFKRVSSAVTDILGWTIAEFLARPYLELVHPDDHVATLKEVEKQVVLGEKVLHFENRYRHKDGSWRVLSWRSVPQADGLMYATARDITESKRIDEEFQRLNSQLQHRATQLEAANKELEAFSYSVSHDLRAPLRHVQGYVGMLTREADAQLSDKSRRYLQTIADAGREMGKLIDDLLSFSKMGRAEMHEMTVDPLRLVESTRRELELVTRDRTINWKIGDLPLSRGDPAMLKQVFANLIGNAVKYSREREVAEIEIGCKGEEDGRSVFFVRDNGAGFDMRYADKLFGVFQRLHRADQFEGTGIGLANVRRIIARHGGRTWAESAPNAGATFYFTFPRALRPSAPPFTQS